MTTLLQLQTDIEIRVNAIREGHPDWLCRQGCDNCCKRLAEVPNITEEEWNWLKVGLLTLSTEQLLDIDKKMAAMGNQSSRPFVCPFLDSMIGACKVYAYRPVACRTYGFYVQRDKGLYCKEIEAIVEDGWLAEVVWGNHDVIDRGLCGLGESHELTVWYAEWRK
ncbi:YkgJ family cysteine cluster protein [Methylomonas sp. AM2-LC]|uniref:YkgJ family cysteine cluster protein n=1 Tax=Methylomonas sp. AM2-LC TaxID=3153301 RepID=UPI0032660C10